VSCIAYIEKRFNAVHTHIVRVANRLCQEFQADGLIGGDEYSSLMLGS
jgi:hypothetical protein